MRAQRLFHTVREPHGLTLVEVLVALAIVAVLTSFVFTTISTLGQSVEIGEARQEIIGSTRTTLELMSREIQSALLDSRDRNAVFVCADGLNSLPHARIRLTQGAVPVPALAVTYGHGNAQHPLGLDIAANGTVYGTYEQVYNLYRGPFDTPRGLIVSIKPDAVNLPLGPPDRLDFVGLAANIGGFTTNVVTQPAEIRYLIATDSFADGRDNDGDGAIDGADSTLPGGVATLAGTGDVVLLNTNNANWLEELVSLSLYRTIDTTPDNNPFSSRELPSPDPANLWADPQGRYPWHDGAELAVAGGGEPIGRFVYDLQFEFYGRIATQLDDATDTVDNDGDGLVDEADEDGIPNEWGIGWGYQDVRGEDIGSDGDPTLVDTDGTQANGLLDTGEDLGTDSRVNDDWDITVAPTSGIPDNISDNDGTTAEPSIGEGNNRLDSRVMGVWDSRAPDPRNPRSARELDRVDNDGDPGADVIDNDSDGVADDTGAVSRAHAEWDTDNDDAVTAADDFTLMFNGVDSPPIDGWVADREYEPAGRAEEVDENDEADTGDDQLPRAVRITIVARDSRRVLDPIVMSTTVWLAPGG